MDELLKRLWAKFYGWALPSTLAVGAMWLVVYPWTEFAHSIFERTSGEEKFGAFVGLVATLAFVLDAFSTQLYRILEGYLLWPRWLQDLCAARQVKRKARLLKRVNGSGWLTGLALEEFALYPQEDDQITPTRFGNALRAFERYGSTRYNLDTQSTWYELYAVSPKAVRSAIVDTRAAVDFFVAIFYLGVGSSLFAAVLWLHGDRAPQIVIFAISSFVVGLLGHWSAVRTTREWAAAEKSMVNIGRRDLAAKLGFQLPSTLDEEKKMWGLFTTYGYYGTENEGVALDVYRLKPTNTADPSSTTIPASRVRATS